MKKPINKSIKKFSLVELLIVIAILAILLSLLQPALTNIMYTAKNTKCINNLKSLTNASLQYCDDNNDLYPDRGLPINGYNGTPGLIDRYAYYKVDQMADYIPLNFTEWCCPLYAGKRNSATFNGKPCYNSGDYGCLDHGIAHTGISTTYSLHAGLADWNHHDGSGRPTKDRMKLGEPYILLYNGITYELDFLWSDSSTGDNGSVPLIRPGNYITTMHSPPPGIKHLITNTNNGNLRIYGPSVTSWSFHDGSVISTEIINQYNSQFWANNDEVFKSSV
jgi:prepilin-type N-terminal cleavage/methylation domain-containing protein